MSHPRFQGRTLVLATMHSKEEVLAPLLEKHLGCSVVVPREFDTDQFGTFTREVARAGDQLEAARTKAHEAMRVANADVALASEGSFGTHPSIPFVQSNLELLVLVDTRHNQEVHASYRTQDTNSDGQYISSLEEAQMFARKIGFPEHGVIIRLHPKRKKGIHKDITTWEEFDATVSKLLQVPWRKRIYVESDMRAHRNPVRMKAIEQAGKQLITNIQSSCPECTAPGFVAVD